MKVGANSVSCYEILSKLTKYVIVYSPISVTFPSYFVVTVSSVYLIGPKVFVILKIA